MMLRTFVLGALLVAGVASAQVNPDWTTPLEPFRIMGNVYYVGSRDLASYLVVTPAGDVLINANLKSSPPQIRQSVEKLGFKWADTKVLLNSQAHADHAAGGAEVVRETHAKYMVMDADAKVVRKGGGKASFDLPRQTFPPVRVDRVLHDGDEVRLDGTSILVHKTAGHTEGCTTFTLRVVEKGRPLDVAIVCGWSSNPGVRYVDRDGKAASYAGIADDFQRTFLTLEGLHVDVFLGAHGVYFGMLPKLAKGAREHPEMWVDPEGYRKALAEKKTAFEEELKRQKAEQ